jgi:DNA-directed RNA polymerase subunit RPC12/RpoP
LTGFTGIIRGSYTAFVPCPDCGSNRLRVRGATGLEWFVLLFISKRKYRCLECDRVFRSVDRRRVPRTDNVEKPGKACR